MCRFCLCLIDSLSRLSLMAWKIRAYGSISNWNFWAQLGSSDIKLELMGSARLQQIKLDQQLLARPSLAQTGSARCLVNNKQNSNRCSVQYTKPSNPWILTYVSKVKAKCTICNEDWLTTLGFLFLCFVMMLYPFSDHVEWSEVLVVQEIRFIPIRNEGSALL